MKLKQILLWGGLGLVVVIAAVFGFAMLQDSAPFPFLEGKKPLPIKGDMHPFHVDLKRQFGIYAFQTSASWSRR